MRAILMVWHRTPRGLQRRVRGVAGAFFGAAMAALLLPGHAAVAGDGVRWLDDFQRQALQLEGRALALRKRAPDGAALMAASEDTHARETFELPFAGRERDAEMPGESLQKEVGAELIASDLSLADLEIAKLRGFVAGTPAMLGRGRQITRLSLPGASEAAAMRELKTILPKISAAPNEKYTIVVPADETDAEARTVIERNRSVPAGPGPCPAETCFGRELISWQGALGACARGVRVGVIDTSFDLSHPALQRIRAEQGVFLDGQEPSPFDWHGTAVLSLLAGDPSSGTPGLMPDATFLLAAAFRSDADGNASADTARLLAALDWLDAQGVDIVNMSFSGPKDPAVAQAIVDMRKKGILFIAAAGNMGPVAEPSYPAAYREVIAVTAVDRHGAGYRHANRGDYIDLSAPGVDILMALPRAQQGIRSGTSFATPFVTAIAAAHAGGRLAYNVAFEKAGAASLLGDLAVRDLGPPGRDPIYGAGLVHAPEACAHGGDVAIEGLQAPSSSLAIGAQVRRSPTTVIRAGAAGGPR